MFSMENEKSGSSSLSQMKWLATKMNDCFLRECLGSWVDLIELN